jgi:hypothetical protein
MIENEMHLLSIALDHLTLSRVGRIRASEGACPGSGTASLPLGTGGRFEPNSDRRGASPLDDSASSLANPLLQPTLDLPHVPAAVNGLRSAGDVSYLTRSLLTATLHHFTRGQHDLARKHPSEARQIAQRGPMPLFLANIHLTRARMYRGRDSLAQAAHLIHTLEKRWVCGTSCRGGKRRVCGSYQSAWPAAMRSRAC